MSSQICLKWNSFLNNIATSFESLWEEEGLVDVTLASDGQCLTAHKVILSASSPFFKKVFQTNPCQHPVIILQDVHFSELEALLIFIYKGEVNIEQKNLAALLKAAETLQIRGLSGGDIFSKESFKHLAELEQNVDDDTSSITEEAPKKKQKTATRAQNNSILEQALPPQTSRSEGFTDSCTSDRSKDSDCVVTDTIPEEVYQRLEMKIEPFEMTGDDLSKSTPTVKNPLERLSGEQTEGSQGSSRPTVTVIAEARQIRSPSPEPHSFSFAEKELYPKSPQLSIEPSKLSSTSVIESDVTNDKYSELLSSPSNNSPGILENVFPPFANPGVDFLDDAQSIKRGPSYPPFPCPFCDRAYTSWGFRRRHIKAVHTILPCLNCKWCSQVLPTHAAWRRHVITAHNLSANDAHNGLLILEEAHMVLQIAHPTRLDTLVNIIKQSSQQSSVQKAPHMTTD